MNKQAFFKLSYGLYIVSSRQNDRFNGQIANTAIQVTSVPSTLAVSINKENLTHAFIRESRCFSVSILAQDAPMTLIGLFGFKSGRDVDKFETTRYKTGVTGAPIVLDHAVAYIEAEVFQEMDCGTHTIFLGNIVDCDILADGVPMTYAYYHEVKKGKAPKTAPTYVADTAPPPAPAAEKAARYVCSVCGYEYDPEKGDPDSGISPGTPFEDLPDGWTCPVCGAGKSQFEKA
ncbi:MAG TPA: High molecular weight rubredoxin [Syntrophus sp. (in: bacteria)]|nr:High molecular weight rubredoxin [Syntrophus sp. (in: bacteria)]